MALDTFYVDWSPEVRQSFYQDFWEREEVPDSPIKHFFTWHETSSRGRIRHIGQRFKNLFYSTLNLPDEYEWRFERPMGKGSFGAVALFSKVNERQERTDAFVLKVTDADPYHFIPTRSKKSHLTHEAAVMAQANDLDSEVLLRLRQYKVDSSYCRYYTEFCEFGSLETLRLRYKAWNKYFPELFLWHVFHCFAKAYLDFVRGPWRSLKHLNFGEIVPGQYFLHNDLKADNIFLAANPAKDSDTIWYPKPKIGDFGLSVTTHPLEIYTNYAKALQRGTPTWQPPEIRIHEMKAMRYYYFREDVHPELKQKVGDLDRRYHRVRPEANVWALGAVMWSLTTLNEVDVLDNKVTKILYGDNPIARAFDHTNIIKRADPEITRRYSSKLWDLICQCLRMKPCDRPPPCRLLSEIEAGMQECIQRAEAEYARTGDLAPLKVAFEENQINNMADGGARFPKHMNFWPDFADHLLWMPREWGPLCPPEAPRNIDFEADGLPSPLRRRQEQRWEQALEERARRDVAADSQPMSQAQLISDTARCPANPSLRRRNPSEDQAPQPRKRARFA
ncbi:hypothetical protein H2200_004439 [Cladophialophora chaetospira]|uniref:non-specific serine/threonine protein kinase n=1 Tax=Cladophialophora chaetospira TaxID=386627 RepID=A0AA38XD43_9EURO|nr:hypothetical protein H2200_004439 [Cladophialophora chaetospira]